MFKLNNYKQLVMLLVSVMMMLMLSACNNANSQGQNENESDDVIVNDEYGDMELSQAVTSEYKDVNELPDDVMAMVPLCDALNIAQVETATKYTNVNPDFVWKGIRLAIMGADWNQTGIYTTDDCLIVDEDVVDDYAYALFGKLKTLPTIPRTLSAEDSGRMPVVFTDNMKYEFSYGDRGLSRPEVISALVYSDTHIDLEVALVDIETEEEIVDFIYSMRVNTKDISLGARFGYEIYNVRSADAKTYTLMKKIPYITMLSQIYGKDIYDASDARHNEVLEIPWFTCFGVTRKEVGNINDRIMSELGEFLNDDSEDEVSWNEVMTYPVVTSSYIQTVVNYTTFPNYGTMGDITSYNYSVEEDREFTIKDALKYAGVLEEDLIDEIEEEYSTTEEGFVCTDAILQGFIIREDESVDFYLKVFLDNKNAEPFDCIVVHNSNTHKSKRLEMGEEIVPSDIETVMKPMLTHGKEDIDE